MALYNTQHWIDSYLIFYTQSTAKGHIGVKQTTTAATRKILIHCLWHIPLFMIGKL